jgi:hypothetical protein
VGLFASTIAYAQPGADEAVEPEPPPVAAPAPAPLADAPELVAEFDRAWKLLLTEQWDAASKAFGNVAARTVDSERRAVATALSKFGHEMDERADDGPKRTSGRASFVATTTLASFYTGFVLDDFFAVTDIKAQTLVVTGVTLAGFAAGLFATADRRITESMASAYGSGLLVGIGNGLLLAPRMGIDAESSSSADGDVNQNYLAFGLLAMAGGGAAATYLADRYDPTPAQAQFAGLMGVNGLATVGLTLAMIQPDDMDYRNLLLLLALGLDGGVAAGIGFGRDLTWSKSRLTYVGLAEFLGGLTGVAAAVVVVDDADSDDGVRVGAGLVLGGLWGGFALASHLTRDMAPDPRFRLKGPNVSLVPMFSSEMRGIGFAGSF